MDALTISLMLIAALLHSSWHALVKASNNGITVLAGMNLVSAGAALFVVPFVAFPAVEIWPILALSALLQSTYKVSLSYAYRYGDLSQSYPAVRGLTPVFATLIAFMALGERPPFLQLIGTLLLTLGILMFVAEKRDQGFGLRTLAFVAIAALMVAGYSVSNGFGARTNRDWLSYTVWLLLLDGGAFVAAVSATHGRLFWTTIAARWQFTCLSGLLGLISFSVFLWALSRSSIGGVVALRETSVLFAYLIGIVFLKERWSLLRFVGCLLVTLGVATIAAH
jgi:drug/metabolite transporter (DMT)-like permease